METCLVARDRRYGLIMNRKRFVFLLVLMGLFVASCTVEPAEGYEQLTDIDGVEQLSTEFNEQEGSPRLILLLLPT